MQQQSHTNGIRGKSVAENLAASQSLPYGFVQPNP
jgi:hypothetical protein